MAIIVHYSNAIHLILLDPWAISSRRTQADTMSYNIQAFNALSFLHESWIKLEGALHNSICEVWVRQWVPVVLLISSANDSTAA
jgi:hypothetical protein